MPRISKEWDEVIGWLSDFKIDKIVPSRKKYGKFYLDEIFATRDSYYIMLSSGEGLNGDYMHIRITSPRDVFDIMQNYNSNIREWSFTFKGGDVEDSD
jgi:hypothetical protein